MRRSHGEGEAASRSGGRLFAYLAAWLAAAGAILLGGTAQAACTIAKIVELPVTMSGARPLVPARINGQDVRFIADSGAFFSLISPDTAAALKLSVVPSNIRMRGVGGLADLGVATVKSFTLAGVDVPNAEFTVGGSSFGVAGLIGQNILGFADVEYDLAGGAIRLFKPQDCGKAGLAYWAGDKPFSELPIETPSPRDPHTGGIVEINGVKLRAVFDTGAERSIIDLPAAARAGIKPGDPGVVSLGAGSGIGSRVSQVWRARFASFKIGDNEEIRNGQVQVGKLDLGDAEMLIGADFFLSHRVYVSNRQHRLYFTYNGGPAFAVSTHEEGTAPGAAVGVDNRDAPSDADGFARRGAARASRGDLTAALADLDEAVRRAPDRPDILLIRARTRITAHQPADARVDLDRVLTLTPGDAQAHVIRARLRIADRDRTGALADLDAAANALPAQDALRIGLAALYIEIASPERAIPQYTLWIDAHADDSGLAEAYNGRCWARALLGLDLDKALGDCNAALRRRPGLPAYLDSRGLVHLRRGELDKARADYDAAIAANPKLAWALYGRSVIERKQGQGAQADSDRAAALAIRPDLAERARRLGIDN